MKRTLAVAGFKLERIRPASKESLPSQPAFSPGGIQDWDFRVGDWRYEIPIALAVGRPCFGYGTGSWHPYVAAARQILDNPSISADECILNAYFDRWQPRSIAETHFPEEGDHDPVLTRIQPQTLFEPWLRRPPPCENPFDPDCRTAGSPVFGPISRTAYEHEFARITRAISSIQTYGYQPDGFPRGLLKMVVLRHDGEERYLIAHGQHRAAVLAAMGHEVIQVGIHRELPPIVDSAQAEHWPYVANGTVSPETAVKMLARYFTTGEAKGPATHVAGLVGALPRG